MLLSVSANSIMSPQSSSSRLVISFLLLLPLLICLSFVTAADPPGTASSADQTASPVGQSTNSAEAQPGDSSVTASSVEETASRVDGTASSVGRTVGQINPMPSEVTASTTTEVESVENGAAELLRSNVGISMRGNVGPEAFGDLIESVDVRPAQSEESDATVEQRHNLREMETTYSLLNRQKALMIEYCDAASLMNRNIFKGEPGTFNEFGSDLQDLFSSEDFKLILARWWSNSDRRQGTSSVAHSKIDVNGLTYYIPNRDLTFTYELPGPVAANPEVPCAPSATLRNAVTVVRPVLVLYLFPTRGQDDTALTENQKEFFTHFYVNINAMAEAVGGHVLERLSLGPEPPDEPSTRDLELMRMFKIHGWHGDNF
eukprot:GHVS01052101.1.p1 GENE.GHVS01052101.1~~GHVS01052101.1.p1  ORF type:complete len:374 (-),score=59.96 GHVS01052101.1:257-1378(-)